MSMQLKVYGVMALGIGGMVAFSELDKSMNYTQTDAYISKIDVDCFVKNSSEQLEHKDTGDLYYMDCDMAPLIAVAKGMDKSDVKHRFKMEYNYRSPVDGKRYTNDITQTSSDPKRYRRDMNVKIYAHNEEPGKSRWH